MKQIVTLVCLLLTPVSVFAADATVNKPNILILYADDLGYGDVQCYNPQRGKIPTPHIDRLAADGMRFTDGHSSSGVCSPSRYTLLTGRYHWRSRLQRGIVGLWEAPLIPADQVTIGRLAQQHGYTTACIGKWHLGWDWPIPTEKKKYFQAGGYRGKKDRTATDEHRAAWREAFSQPIPGGPLSVGFDEYFGTDVPNWPPYCFIEDDRTVGIPSEFASPRLFARNQASQQGPALAGWTLEPVLPTLADRVASFIRREAKNPEPFLLYLPFTSPHTPLAVNRPWKGKSELNLYADFVMETDAAVGQVLDALQQCGVAEQTLVVFTSDNGCAPYIGVADLERKGHYPSGPLRGYKADVWEGGHCVPFIVRWPGTVQPGSVCDQLVHQADLLATFADLFDTTLPDDAGEDSFSLLPLLRGDDAPVRQTAVSCSIRGIPSLRQGTWKYIAAPGSGGWGKEGDTSQPVQLYDLAEDIGETRNLAAQQPERVVQMQKLLEQLITKGRSTPGEPQKNDVKVHRFRPAAATTTGAPVPNAKEFIPATPLYGGSDEAPNIVVIYTDDQGYGDVGCLNDEAKVETPNLDRLAREGITFTDGHCSDTVCTPSRYGLLTGRYCWRTELKRGVLGAEHPCLIDDERTTLASMLRDHGYCTAIVGKWHLGMDFPGEITRRDWSQPVRDMPLDKGFDHFWGIPASMNYGVLAWFHDRYPLTPPTLYARKKPNRLAISDYRIRPPYDQQPRYRTVDGAKQLRRNELEVAPDFVDVECLTRFTDQAIDWLEKNASSDPQAKPFFLYLPYTSPHKPVIPIERFRGKSDAGAYGDFLMETDWHVGRILNTLRRLGVDRQTMVILTSDNGPENTWRERAERYGHRSNGIFREGKRSIYEGGHRVPFFIRWPAKIDAGRVCETPICQTDLLATIAGLLNISLPPQAAEDSIDLSPLLLARSAAADDATDRLSRSRPPIVHHGMNGRFAIRHGRWKLVMESQKPPRPRELYDLSTDPGETRDRLADHPEVADKLADQLRDIVRNGRTTKGRPQPNDTPWWDDLVWMEAW